MTNKMQVQFLPSEHFDGETEVILTNVDPNHCEIVYQAIVDLVEEKIKRWQDRGGLMQNAEGEYSREDKFAWVFLDDGGGINVYLDTNTITLTFLNVPEGDDALDGMHPHWKEMSQYLWISASARIKNLFAGKIQ